MSSNSVIPFAAKPQMDTPRSPDRSLVAQEIAHRLWTQRCAEEGMDGTSFEDAIPRGFLEAAEFITNFTLSPDRAETAILAMADTICSDGDPRLSIFHASERTQKAYYALAVSALYALQENVKDVPPDPHYRDELCRLVDAIVPFGGAK